MCAAWRKKNSFKLGAGDKPGVQKRRVLGVLALQGAVEEQTAVLKRLGCPVVPVRLPQELELVDALLLPGGESTTMGVLMERFGLLAPLQHRLAGGMPAFGLCAGMILLAKQIEDSQQTRLGALDISVRRNAYGRQVESFEADLSVPAVGQLPFRAVFIRAPQVASIGNGVEVLAALDHSPVLVRQGRILAASFHPELTTDLRLHRYFLQQVAR